MAKGGNQVLSMLDRALLSVKEASEFLHVSKSTIYRLKESNEIPYIQKPKLGIKFEMDVLRKWLEESSYKPLPIFPSTSDCRTILNSPPDCVIPAPGGLNGMPRGKSKSRINLSYGAIYVRTTKKGNIRWYLDYKDENRKRVQRLAPNASTREEAAVALEEAVRDVFNGRHGLKRSNTEITFGEFSDSFYENYLKPERKNWKSDYYRMMALKDYFKNVALANITPGAIRDFKSNRIDAGNSHSTINRYLALLKRMFTVAIEDGLASENPAKKIKLFSERDTQRDRVISHEEESELLKQCSPRLKVIVILALNTGMRHGEIVNLKWTDINFTRREIKLENTKSKRVRYIPMNQEVYDLFQLMKEQNGNSKNIFPFKSIRTAFENARERASLEDITFHDLRRTFGTRLLELGVDIVTIQKLYGHSSPLVTQRYLHPSEDLQKEAVNLLSNRRAESYSHANLLHPRDTAARGFADSSANN